MKAVEGLAHTLTASFVTWENTQPVPRQFWRWAKEISSCNSMARAEPCSFLPPEVQEPYSTACPNGYNMGAAGAKPLTGNQTWSDEPRKLTQALGTTPHSPSWSSSDLSNLTSPRIKLLFITEYCWEPIKWISTLDLIQKLTEVTRNLSILY